MRYFATILLLLCGSVNATPACYPGPGDPVRIGSTYSAPTKQTVRWIVWWCHLPDGRLAGAWLAGASEVQFRAAFNEAAASGFDPATLQRLWGENVIGSPAVEAVRPTIEANWLAIKP